ncbi:MAG: Rpn family recombination-promoting nuclease/putative transposase [Puniceicoccales bacterium]|jgi:tetrahydromethanopterin S-methyltransferase subunit G|nr:Rpn family recombination-promoting nuclease/putative transposase [Puniceicoccales bacterium]
MAAAKKTTTPDSVATDADDAAAHQPHDKFFKSIFANIPTAIGFLKNYLPEAVVRCLDLTPEHVTHIEDSYVSDTFKQVEADLLFSVPLKTGGKAPMATYVYVLWEHQYKEDRHIGLRLLGYMVSIWKEYLKKHPKAKKLPFILPLVLAQNKKAWRVLPHFGPGQFVLPAEQSADFARYVPGFDFAIIETAKLADSEIRGTPAGAFALQVMKAQREGPAALASDRIWKSPFLLQPGLLSDEELSFSVRYMLHTGLDKDTFERRTNALPRTTRGTVMTAAEQYKRIGRLEGKQIGRLEGQRIGDLVGCITTAQRFLGLKPTPKAELFAQSLEELRATYKHLCVGRLTR